mmetsp:Transcript_67094/g.108771  ORF Transcript_67094/g.108771 Transcript_67094/m.108771 type:complete len:254 (+) Transcript_67094:227-988(+)
MAHGRPAAFKLPPQTVPKRQLRQTDCQTTATGLLHNMCWLWWLCTTCVGCGSLRRRAPGFCKICFLQGRGILENQNSSGGVRRLGRLAPGVDRLGESQCSNQICCSSGSVKLWDQKHKSWTSTHAATPRQHMPAIMSSTPSSDTVSSVLSVILSCCSLSASMSSSTSMLCVSKHIEKTPTRSTSVFHRRSFTPRCVLPMTESAEKMYVLASNIMCGGGLGLLTCTRKPNLVYVVSRRMVPRSKSAPNCASKHC